MTQTHDRSPSSALRYHTRDAAVDPRDRRARRRSGALPLVEEVIAMINAAYAADEQGMWRPDTPRIFEAEVRALLDAGELMVVRRHGALAGCVRVHALDSATGELGLFESSRARL